MVAVDIDDDAAAADVRLHSSAVAAAAGKYDVRRRLLELGPVAVDIEADSKALAAVDIYIR